MSVRYAIEAPHTIASLPRPFVPVHGTTRAGPVFHANASRKRKRNEVVVGIDGEAINIYSVKAQKLLTSYPIPPESLLTSRPTSLLVPSSDARTPRRLTYASIRASVDSTNHTLVCHAQDISKSGGVQTKHECEAGTRDNPIVHLETISGAEETSLDSNLLIVSARGDLTVRSADLSTVIASLALPTTESPLQVELVSVQAASQASAGLLKTRQDLVASLGPSSLSSNETKSGDSELLLIITRPTADTELDSEGYTLHLLTIRRQNTASAHRAVFQTLEQWPLPAVKVFKQGSGKVKFAIDVASGTLYQLAAASLFVYEASTRMQLVHEFQLPFMDHQMLPITRSTMLLASPESTLLYDTKYGSSQAVLRTAPEPSSKRKRKRSSRAVFAQSLALFDYHPNLETATALIGQDLVAFQLTLPRKRKGLATSRLIDSLGRGYVPATPANALTSGAEAQPHPLLAVKKLDAFDRHFAELVEAIDAHDPAASYQYLELALIAIAAIFDWASRGPANRLLNKHASSIRVVLSPPQTTAWIRSSGYLTPGNIAKALYENRPPADGALPSVTPIDLVAAIANQDPSLAQLAALVSTTQLDLPAWIESLKYFITSFSTPDGSEQPLLTNGPTDDAAASPELKPADAEAEAGDDETALALLELDLTLSKLSRAHAETRASALRTVVARLALSYSPKALVPALRAQLRRPELLLLVDVLRVELATSGWTSPSRRLDVSPGETGVDAADEAISLIAGLLNACVDALGVGAWLSAADSPSPSPADSSEASPELSYATPLTTLREATTSALEAAQESAFFANFLTDFLRFEAATAAAAAERDRLERDDVFNASRVVVQPVRRAPGGAMSGRGLGDSMLPLSARAVEPVERTRVDAGGGVVERSKRDVMRRMSRRVGVYEFERLRV